MNDEFYDIQRVSTAYFLKTNEEEQIKKQKFEPIQIVRRKLINELADYILKNMDKLPIELENYSFQNGKQYTLQFTIISNEELCRLKYIEGQQRGLEKLTESILKGETYMSDSKEVK